MITENNKLHEEIRNLNLKNSTETSIFIHELDILKKTITSLEGDKIDLITELQLIKENYALSQTQNNSQSEIIQNLKDEKERSKISKENDLILLYEELQETKSEKDIVEQQNLALQSELNILTEENEKWKELDFPSQLLKAEEVIKDQESLRIKLEEELKNTSNLWLSKIDSISKNYNDSVRFSLNLKSNYRNLVDLNQLSVCQRLKDMKILFKMLK